jgi:mRNA-degrading endonuclease RelE of RelBE toxin-antitoxin system
LWVPRRTVKLGPEAVRQFKALRAAERSRLKTAMQAALSEDDATVENKNRFRLRRPSGQVEFEFRDGDLRVFYRIEGAQVLVDAIGRKHRNQLLIGGRKVIL